MSERNAPFDALTAASRDKAVPLASSRAPAATKQRILDTAESLFMEHGFEATSLRSITAAAGVNLAAVNYHFGSKEELFQSVLTRRLDPMNHARLALLTRLEREAGPHALSCDKILTALFVPALALARDPARGGKNFLRLLGRAYADPAPFIRQFLSTQYALDYGAHGIRSNAVNADRIRSGLLTDAMIASRSGARGVSEKEYMSGNLLGQEVTADDVAQAFLHQALAERTTADVTTVDGGNIAAALR